VAVERLQKILSHAGVSSRRAAEALMASGRVAVNGVVMTEPGSRADPETDEITVDGVPVNRARYRYVLLNKPSGVVTTVHDEMGRPTVLDLVPGAKEQGLHPVGRLDTTSEGLLLLTNDGHLTNFLTHPRYGVEKEYLVRLDSMISDRDLQRMTRGIESQGERLRAQSVARVTPPGHGQAEAWLRVVLQEGKNREIRRMLETLGRRAITLRRIRLGPLHLGDVPRAASRELTAAEVERLYASAGSAAHS